MLALDGIYYMHSSSSFYCSFWRPGSQEWDIFVKHLVLYILLVVCIYAYIYIYIIFILSLPACGVLFLNPYLETNLSDTETVIT